MKIRWLLVALLALIGAVSGCGGDEKDNPFLGAWVSRTAVRITFQSDIWLDSEGDAGTYSYTGEYPDYTLIFGSASGTQTRRATFADANTLELCPLAASSGDALCENLVVDRPTIF